MLLGGLLGWLPETYERSLAKAVASFGPLIAIGDPGERLASFGAARLYVQPGEWRRVVTDIVQDAQLVILRAGVSSGFLWELDHVLAHCDPHKVLIYLPPEDHGQVYSDLRLHVKGRLRQALPASPGQALFLGFGLNWTPRLFGIRGPSWSAQLRRLLTGSQAPAVREALNVAVKRLRRPVHRLPFQFREWVVFGLITLFALYVLMLRVLSRG
jgi:hypothetical protein